MLTQSDVNEALAQLKEARNLCQSIGGETPHGCAACKRIADVDDLLRRGDRGSLAEKFAALGF